MKIYGYIKEIVELWFKKNGQDVKVVPNSNTYTGTTSFSLPPKTSGSTTLVDIDGSQTLTNKTLGSGTSLTAGTLTGVTINADSNTITNIDNNEIKTGAAIDASKIADGSVSNAEFQYLDGVTSSIQTQINGKQPLDSTLTSFAAYNTNGLLTQTAADTFTGRTITGTTNKISVTNGDGVSGNPVLNIGSDVVTLTDSQSLSNKTLTSPVITGGATLRGDLLLQNTSGSQPTLQLSEDPDNGTNKITMQAPASLTADWSLTLPTDAGTSGYVLQTDGSGNSYWGSVASSDSPTFTTTIKIPDGSVTVPSLAFTTDADGSGTGIYRVAANSLGFSANGVNVGQYSAGGAWTLGPSGGSQYQSDNVSRIRLTSDGSQQATIRFVNSVGDAYIGPDNGGVIGPATNEFVLASTYPGGITFSSSSFAKHGSIVGGAWTLGSTSNTNNSVTIPNNGYITSNTSDAADNKSMTISGGGGGTSWNQNRGAGIVMQGNEVSGAEGELVYYAGNAGGTFSRHRFVAGGVDIAIGSQTGAWTLGPAAGPYIATASTSTRPFHVYANTATSQQSLFENAGSGPAEIGIRGTGGGVLRFYNGATEEAVLRTDTLTNGLLFEAGGVTVGQYTSAGAWTFNKNTTHTFGNSTDAGQADLVLNSNTGNQPILKLQRAGTTKLHIYADSSLSDLITIQANSTICATSTQAGAWTLGPSSGLTTTHTIRAATLEPLNINNTNASATSTMVFATAGVQKVRIGYEGAANDTTTGTTAGDVIIRNMTTTGSGGISFGGGASGSVLGRMGFDGAWTLGASSGTQTHTIEGEILNKYSGTNVFKVRSGTSGKPQVDIGSSAVAASNQNASMYIYESNASIAIRNTATSGTVTMLVFGDGSPATCGTITSDLSADTTSYNTSSDARLKHLSENFDALNMLNVMQPKKYERISNPGVKEYGFYAQELYEVLPQAVQIGGEDADSNPWSIDYGKLTPVLAKAIQELKAKNDALEARIAALEGA